LALGVFLSFHTIFDESKNSFNQSEVTRPLVSDVTRAEQNCLTRPQTDETVNYMSVTGGFEWVTGTKS